MNVFLLLAICLLSVAVPSGASNDSYYNYLRGLMEEREGHPNKALEAYEKVVQEDPQALEAFRDIAELRLRMGQPEEALRAAEHVKELAPADPTSFLFLGNVLVAQGNLAKAAEAYEKALKIDPKNLRALENLGNYYAILDPDKALTYYQRYIEIDPRDPDIFFQMALVYHKRGNVAKAQALYQQSLDIDPKQLASRLALADLYDDQKSTAAAAGEYIKATQAQPGNPMIFMRLGNLYYRDRQWTNAEEAFKAAEVQSPKEPTVHYWLARLAEERKDWKTAAAEAQKAYDLSQDAQFLPLLAYYLTLDRQLEKAVTYLEKAREGDPANSNVLLFLGMDYLDLDKPEKAREALANGVLRYPKDPQMRFQLAIAEDRLGHFDEAMREFQELLKLDPKNGAALNYLGYSWADKGIRLEEAEKLLVQAVALEPENGAFLDSLGWVRYKRGAYSEARNLLEKAVMHSPDPLIFDHLGDACLADHHPEAALQAWSKALSADPKNEAVRKKLQEEGSKFINEGGAKKYTTYLEGNFKQAKTLACGMAFDGRLNKRPMGAQGTMSYAQPDHMVLDVPAAGKRGPVRFILNGSGPRVEPAETNPMLSQTAFRGMTSLTQLLSGNATEGIQVVLDSKTGLQARLSRPNPSGGHDEILIVSYDFVEGLWLPADIRIHNRTIGWDADLKFSSWTVNSTAP